MKIMELNTKEYEELVKKGLVEEEKKLPEKLDEYVDIGKDIACEWSFNEKKLKDKINEVIDYLKSKGE